MDLTSDPRAAGEIRRYHTWAIHHQQSVGEHTWQVLRILLTVWPNCSRNMMIYVLIHDMGEMAGDIPYPFKVLIAGLRAAMDAAEKIVHDMQRKTVGLPEPKQALSEFERVVFKACENIEMWECGLHEINMGNRYAIMIRDRMNAAVAKNIEMLETTELATCPQAMQNPGVVTAIRRYMQDRLTMEK